MKKRFSRILKIQLGNKSDSRGIILAADNKIHAKVVLGGQQARVYTENSSPKSTRGKLVGNVLASRGNELVARKMRVARC